MIGTVNVDDVIDFDYFHTLMNDFYYQCKNKIKTRKTNDAITVDDLVMHKTEILINKYVKYLKLPTKDKYNKSTYTNIVPIQFVIPPFHKLEDDIVDLILCLRNDIPIVCQSPKEIYWQQVVWKSVNGTRYSIGENKKNKQSIVYDEVIHTKPIHLYKLTNHQVSKKKLKYNLIYKIIESEISRNVRSETIPDIVTVQTHYNRVIKKYARAYPGLDLHDFESYTRMHNKLYKKKTCTHKLESRTIEDYIHNEYENTLNKIATSYNCMKRLKEETLIEYDGNNLIISNKKLLRILFQSNGMGTDGTYNVIPFFLKEYQHKKSNGRCKIHSQVFRLFAYKIYDCEDRPLILTYFIGNVLLTGSSEIVYKWVFEVINKWKNDDPNINVCELKEFICDFEVPQRNAVSKSWLKDYIKNINGEEFHFKQALVKQIRTKGLSRFYINRKDSNDYDHQFKRYIELLFNLQYVEVKLVSKFVRKIILQLWIHVKKKHLPDGSIQQMYLNWIKYFLQYWCSYTLNDVHNLLQLKGEWKNYSNTHKGAKQTYTYEDWNLCHKQITNSCSIEVNNKWNRMQMGYYPMIGKFVEITIRKFDEEIRKYNNHQQGVKFTDHYQNKTLKKKHEIVKTAHGKMFSWAEYLQFSAKLTMNRFGDNQRINYYFTYGYNKQDTSIDIITYDETFFNDDLLNINQYNHSDNDADDEYNHEHDMNSIYTHNSDILNDTSAFVPFLEPVTSPPSIVSESLYIPPRKKRRCSSPVSNGKKPRRKHKKHSKTITNKNNRSTINITSMENNYELINQPIIGWNINNNNNNTNDKELNKKNTLNKKHNVKTSETKRINLPRQAKTRINIRRASGIPYEFYGGSADEKGSQWHKKLHAFRNIANNEELMYFGSTDNMCSTSADDCSDNQKTYREWCCGKNIDENKWLQCHSNKSIKKKTGCPKWFHWRCIGFTQEIDNIYKNKKWYCRDCGKLLLKSTKTTNN